MNMFKSAVQALISVLMAVVMGVTNTVPYLAVIPDMIKVGIDYISLNRYADAVSKKELLQAISNLDSSRHPFVLADEADFKSVKAESESDVQSIYSKALYDSVIANADAISDLSLYPVMAYELDEEDSILPISREVINRIIILGCAWQITGDKKYAERAWAELENVCGYSDWCPSHFLATAEMALAVSVGYDWFFDYLDGNQKTLLAEKTFEYAVKPALSKNYLENWFT